MIPYRTRPGLGFCWLMATLLVVVGFIFWGLRMPALEEIWRINIDVGLGQRPPLSAREFQLLQRELKHHKELAAAITENQTAGIFSLNTNGRVEIPYAYLVRATPATPNILQVDCEDGKKNGSLTVHARTAKANYTATANKNAPFIWKLPNEGPFPQLIELLLDSPGKKKSGMPQTVPVRIHLRLGLGQAP